MTTVLTGLVTAAGFVVTSRVGIMLTTTVPLGVTHPVLTLRAGSIGGRGVTHSRFSTFVL